MEYIPLSSCPGGVSTLAVEQGMKAGLTPCRHTGLGKLMLSWPNGKQDRDPSPPKKKTDQWFVYMDVLYKTNLHCENKSVIAIKARKQQGESVYRKHVLLRTELNSFQLFGESVPVEQGRLFYTFHRHCSFLGFSP